MSTNLGLGRITTVTTTIAELSAFISGEWEASTGQSSDPTGPAEA